MIYLTVVCGLLILLAAGLVAALMLERKATAELLAHFEQLHQGERARIMSAPPRMVQQPQAQKRRAPAEVQAQYDQARNFAAVGTVQHAKGD
jgi:uncharacterized membrane protein YraQ (UPF0718 family)